MVDYLVPLAVILLVLLVPQTRKAVLRLIGLSLIASAAVASIGLPVWALYEIKSGPSPVPSVVETADEEIPEPVAQEEEPVLADLQDEDSAAPAPQEAANPKDEAEAEAQALQVPGVAEKARAIVEREKRYATLAATSNVLTGVDRVSADFLVLRVPSWRDRALAEREQAMILDWLVSIGLTSEQAASIYTANGWGAVYDLWSAENPTAVTLPTARTAPLLAPAPPPVEPVPEPVRAPAREQPPAYAERRPMQPRVVPRREPPPPRIPPRRPPEPERQIGPFGY